MFCVIQSHKDIFFISIRAQTVVHFVLLYSYLCEDLYIVFMNQFLISRARHDQSHTIISRVAASMAAVLVLATNLSAQEYPNGLNEDSVNPQADKEFIQQANQRMRQIRETYNRPTVGLVLSGGGAKGAAEVGALKYIEELGIPIDLVTGTSIGGLVGGLYSMGYTPDDLRELFVTQDWNLILSDNVDERHIPYLIREYNSKSIYSIKLGRRQRLSSVATLPAGYAYGFNVNNLFSSLAVGYEGDISFNQLPIPFSCVAADIAACKAYNWTGGMVTDALRSTMSIPGLFAPVKTKDMVLVDGGVRNNFPADMAKAMGADIIIGIELSDARPTYEQIDGIGKILSQFISMLNREVYDTNLEIADIIIKPNLDGYNMLSFTPEAVDTMILRGYNAAKAKGKDLLAIREKVGTAQGTERVDRKAIDISKTPVKIGSIRFDGLNEYETDVVDDMIGITAGQMVDRNILNEAMSILQASDYFSEVKYSLQGSGEPYELVFDCTLAPVNKLGFGFRGDSVEGVSLYTNFGLNANKVVGSKLNFELKISHNLKAKARYFYVRPNFPVFNIEASFHNSNMDMQLGGEKQSTNIHYQSHNEAIYLSAGRWKQFNFKFGIQNYAANIVSVDLLSLLFTKERSEDYAGIFGEAHLLSYNDTYFPTKGSNIKFEARYDFARLGRNQGFKPMTYLSLYQRSVFSIGNKFAIIPSLSAMVNINPQKLEMNSEDELDFSIPLMSKNYIGGTLDKRYHRNHMTFFGISKAQMADDYLLTGTLELRYNPINNLYCSALAGYLNSNGTLKNFFNSAEENRMYAFGTQISYKTPIGPVRLNVHWNSQKIWGTTLSIGYDF